MKTFAALAVVLTLIVIAFIAGRNVESPSQAAATAKAPAASIITSTVSERVLAQTTVFRGDVGSTAALQVGLPQLPSGSNPVVTSTEARQGDLVSSGGVLASIAGRPVIVLEGTVPAFRTMQYGESGIDVSQLQQALMNLGYGVGNDRAGFFGEGTSRAVRWLYNKAGYQPVSGPDLAAAPISAGAAPIPPTPSWSASLGEVVFVPQLPVRVASDTLRVGQNVTASGGDGKATASDPSSMSILTLGTGGISVTGQVAAADAAGLRPGMTARLDDAITGGAWTGRVVKVARPATESDAVGGLPRATVTIAPAEAPRMPDSEIGQNIRVTVTSARTNGKVLVVPISALFARPDGRTYVKVTGGKAEREVPVTVGLDSSGNVEVSPLKGARLNRGDRVVIGATAPTSR